MAFTCHICFEAKASRFALPRLATINGDQIRGSDCDHPICAECMASWVEARVSEHMVFGIRCPSPGCKSELYQQDIQRLTDCGVLQPAVRDRFVELRARDYSTRADGIAGELREVQRRYQALRSRIDTVGVQELEEILHGMANQHLFKNMRVCPGCRVVVEKSQGCNSFGCICGHRFDFATAPAVCSGTGELRVVQKALVEMRRGVSWRIADLRVKSRCGDHDARQLLRDAAKVRKLERKMAQVMAATGLSLAEVQDLFRRAEAQDHAAWYAIRGARQRFSEGDTVARKSVV